MLSLKHRRVLGWVVLGCVSFVSPAHTAPPGSVDSAILNQEWPAVRDSVASPTSRLPRPVRLALLGHSDLAGNKNDDSLCEFLTLCADSSRALWTAWTDSLVRAHPVSAVAHYLYGDALARQACWSRAICAFDSALVLDPRCFLALNARSICYVAQASWDEAVLGFRAASEVAPGFADAHANLGAAWILQSDAPEGALAAFQSALTSSPNFALAHNGHACALLELGQVPDAEGELLAVQGSLSKCLEPLAHRVSRALAAIARRETDLVAGALSHLAGIEPGMSVEMASHRIASLTPIQRGELAEILPSAARWNKLVDWAGAVWQPLMPTQTDVHVGTDNLSIDSRWEVSSQAYLATAQNLSYQQQNVQLLQKYDVTPTRLGPIDALRARVEYRDLLHPIGGVTTEPVGGSRVDRGDWAVSTFFGLAYPVAQSVGGLSR